MTTLPQHRLERLDRYKVEISSWPWHNVADDYQIRDDISLTRARTSSSSAQAGLFTRKVQDLFGETQGGFNFDGTFTGNDFADFLLGDAKNYQELAVQDSGHWNNVSWAAYVQDNWRVNRNADPQPRFALGRRAGTPTKPTIAWATSTHRSTIQPTAATLLADGSNQPEQPGTAAVRINSGRRSALPERNRRPWPGRSSPGLW